MRKLVFLSLMPFVLIACSKSSAVSKKLSGADSLVITFNVPNGDSVINRVATTDAKAIKKLSGYLGGKELKEQNCGFDGNMTFFKSGEALLPVVFQYNVDSCRRFIFSLEGKTIYSKMSNEVVDFLKSLGEGRNWY